MALWQFWTNWVVQLGIAVGTILAVIVALFGGWLRGHFMPPSLTLKLQDTRGVQSPCFLISPNGTRRQSESRWYCVKIENSRRWSPATQTQVLMLEIQEPDAAGEMKPIWFGAMPIKWRSEGHLPFGKTIGAWAECDVCSVIKGGTGEKEGWVAIHPAIPEPAMKVQRTSACRFVLVLQARRVEADSNVLRVEIAWDGRWADDSTQMARHLVIN